MTEGEIEGQYVKRLIGISASYAIISTITHISMVCHRCCTMINKVLCERPLPQKLPLNHAKIDTRLHTVGKFLLKRGA